MLYQKTMLISSIYNPAKTNLFRLIVCNYSEQKSKVFGYAVRPDINKIQQDYIGPPDKESNLRPILRFYPKNPSKLQIKLRNRRIEIAQWNEDFWKSHNKRFYEEKEEFISTNKPKNADFPSSDTMSIFYKSFLDKNWQLHFYYNISWYIKNIELLFLVIIVKIQSLCNIKLN